MKLTTDKHASYLYLVDDPTVYKNLKNKEIQAYADYDDSGNIVGVELMVGQLEFTDRVAKLEAKLEKALDCIKFYAEEDNWYVTTMDDVGEFTHTDNEHVFICGGDYREVGVKGGLLARKTLDELIQEK